MMTHEYIQLHGGPRHGESVQIRCDQHTVFVAIVDPTPVFWFRPICLSEAANYRPKVGRYDVELFRRKDGCIEKRGIWRG